MSSSLHISSILPPLHLLIYSSLLGTQLWHSLIIVKILHSTLPRAQFTTVQKTLFPIYFKVQTSLVVLTAITYPPISLLSLAKNRYEVIALGITFVGASLNVLVWGPRAEKAMIARIHQGQFFIVSIYIPELGFGNWKF